MAQTIEGITEGKGLVVSDLHIGKPGSRGQKVLNALHEKIAGGDVSLIVLNGDILEGSNLPGSRHKQEATMDASTGQLRKLIQASIEANPEVKILYVFGNQDYTHKVKAKVEALQEEFSGNFLVEHSVAKIGNVLFTHGDLHFKSSGTKLQRAKARIKGELEISPTEGIARNEATGRSGLTDAQAPTSGMQTAKSWTKHFRGSALDTIYSPIIYPLDRVAPAVLNSLRSSDPDILSGVDAVFLGHIHPPHTKTEHAGEGEPVVRVTGSGTVGSKTAIYTFDVNAEGKLDNFESFATGRWGGTRAR